MLCQTYPPKLEGLIYIKEYIITLAYLIGVVIKLISGGKSLGIEYYRSRGYFIIFK